MKSFFLEKGYIIIPFKIMNSQHISCNLILNNKKSFFLIDTGASNSCIDKNKRIYFNLIKNDSEIEVAGAGLEKLKVTPTKKSSFIFENDKSVKLSLMLLNMDSINNSLKEQKSEIIDGILGADFMKKTNTIIDYKSKNIYLKF